MARTGNPSSNGANIGYEAELRRMAGALRGGISAWEHKPVVERDDRGRLKGNICAPSSRSRLPSRDCESLA